MELRREPFRILFPLGMAVGLAGVVPWPLYAQGALTQYPGLLHALTMTQGFLLLPAFGFLGTMLPRRSQSAPLSALELAAAGAGPLLVPVLFALGHPALAELLCAGSLAAFGVFVVLRVRRIALGGALPGSFVLLPAGLASGFIGAVMLALAFGLDLPSEVVAIGRGLAQEGLWLCLVLALAPMLTSILAEGQGAAFDAVRERSARRFHLALGAVIVGSLFMQPYALRAALAIRGAAALAAVLGPAGLRKRVSEPGLHRRIYRLALLMVPAGLLAAAVVPDHRVACMHLTFVGGFALMVQAVGSHVMLMHGGRAELARRNPWWIPAMAAASVGAAVLRCAADWAGIHYLSVLAAAASLWMLGTLLWAIASLPILIGAGRRSARGSPTR